MGLLLPELALDSQIQALRVKYGYMRGTETVNYVDRINSINCNLPAAYRTKSISLSCLYSNQWKYGAGDSNRKSGLY